MSTPGIIQIPVRTTAVQAWTGMPSNSPSNPGTVLYQNTDLTNTVYLGNVQSISASQPTNTIPLLPNASISLPATMNVFVVGGVTGVSPLIVIPGGASPFLGLTQGLGNLAIPSIHSPNFVHGISGWSINQNGTAEFQGLILPSGVGVSAFFQPTAPVTTHIGDLWYNTSNGLELNQWNGSAWVPFQIASGAIAPLGIQPGNIASLTSSLIGNLGVLNPNPYITGGDFTGWTGSGNVSAVNPPPSGAPNPHGFAVAMTSPSGLSGNLGMDSGSTPTGLFPVIPGQQYNVIAWLYHTNASATTITIGRNTYLNGVYAQSTNFAAPSVPVNTWTPVNAVFTAETTPTINQAGIYFALPANGSTAWTVYAMIVLVMPQVPGGLIQTGTVTATQIAANTITAGQLAAGIVYAGIVDATIIKASEYIATNTAGQFLAYSGTPALHNLLATIAGASGSDSFTNAYLDGFEIQAFNNTTSTTAYAQLHVNTGVTPNPPALELHTGLTGEHGGAAIYNLAQNAGAVNEAETLFVLGPASTFDSKSAGMLLQSSQKNGAGIGGGSLQWNGAGQIGWGSGGPVIFTPGGFANQIPGTQTDATAHSNATTTPNALSKVWFINGNDSLVGTVYRMKVYGNGTQWSTTAEDIVIQGSGINGTGGPWASTQLHISGFIGVGVAFSWEAEISVTIKTLGTTGTCDITIRGSVAPSAGTVSAGTNNIAWTRTIAGVTINTTTSTNITCQGMWTATAGTGGNLTCLESTFERIGE